MDKQEILEQVAYKWRDLDAMTIDERAASFMYVHEILDAAEYVELLAERDKLRASVGVMTKLLKDIVKDSVAAVNSERQRVNAMERVVEAARYVANTEDGTEAFYDVREELDKALTALDKAGENNA